MPCREDDDKPFNPFYIGPHPSQACAIAPPEPDKCSPSAKTGNQMNQTSDTGADITMVAAAAGVAQGSGPGPSALTSVAVATNDDTCCQSGKQGSGGNTDNNDNADNTVNAGTMATAAIASQSPARRSADSIVHDEQKNGHTVAANTTVITGASLPGNSNVAGGLLIVGMAGPTGGVATIYSTGQIPNASVVPPVPNADTSPQAAPTNQSEEQAQQADESKPCRTYPCMERNRDRPY